MNEAIRQLEPKILWKHFADICNIPHPSGHEKQLAAHIMEFARARKLECKQDAAGNILLRKAPSPGCESKSPVILQAHLDMVPQKTADKQFDFLSDSIETIIEGPWVRANMTTLGADDGIGVAAILAVMESDLENCGEIFGLLTVEEETGLVGAQELSEDFLPGELLINLDAGSKDSIYVGCAGGISNSFTFENIMENSPAGYVDIRISLDGLSGGHSGAEIHLNRANSIKIITALIAEAASKFKLHLVELNGGSVNNAIPREAQATVLIAESQRDDFREFFSRETEEIKIIYSKTDPDMNWEFELSYSYPEKCLKPNAQRKIIEFVRVFPNGVISMHEHFADTVRTSANLAIVETSDDSMKFSSSHRSSSSDDLQQIQHDLKSISGQYRAAHDQGASYPGWEPQTDSPLLSKAKEVFTEINGQNPKEVLVHAGLECGIFSLKKPQLQMIAICPDMKDYHSPYERLSVPSSQIFWKILLKILQSLD